MTAAPRPWRLQIDADHKGPRQIVVTAADGKETTLVMSNRMIARAGALTPALA